MRERVKNVLAGLPQRAQAAGATLLIYHRVGGGTSDELDLSVERFADQLDELRKHDVLSLDGALDRLDADDSSPSVVLTFDDGFSDVHTHAWPLLRQRAIPFTIYLASAYVDAPMRWPGSTSTSVPGHGLTWEQLGEMVDSGLCTIGNHTHRHTRPELVTPRDLDECTDAVQTHLDVRPHHFTYPWGIAVPALEPGLRERFRSASTGELGRNLPGTNRWRLRRVPVRRTDPLSFFRAKLDGALGPERAYATIVGAAKSVGVRA